MNTNPMLHRDLAAERHASLNRRRFLRGFGACLALPALESLAPLHLLAAPTAGVGVAGKLAPVRMAVL